LKAEKNESKLRFDVYIKKRIKDGDNILLLEDFVDLDYFTDYWNESKSNPKFNILVLDIN
jgi:hypothetical protein